MLPYQQSNAYTGGASALLVVLNHYNPKFRLAKPNEFEIWQRSALLPLKTSCVFALSAIAKQNGLNPKVVVGKQEFEYPGYRFKGYKLSDIKDAAFMSQLFYHKAKNLGVEITVEDFSLSLVKSLLLQNRVLILRLNSFLVSERNHSSNLIPVFGYSNNKYLIIDTQEGAKKLLTDEEMEESFETLKTKCKRDPRMILF